MNFIFPNTWDDDPIWRIFFQRGRYATNQKMYDTVFDGYLMGSRQFAIVWPMGPFSEN